MRRINYALVPELPLDTPVYRKGRKPVRPKPRPYPKPASSVVAAAIITARRRSREDARPMVSAPAFQDNYVGFHYAPVPERPLDATPVYRKGRKPVKSRPRPYPKPAASVGAATVLAARRRSREDSRPLVPAPGFQDVGAFQDNYVVFPPAIAGYVPEHGDDMEIDATGPFFTPVACSGTYGNRNSLPDGVAMALNGITFHGAPPIQLMVGYVPEFSETMDVDWEGPSIPSNPLYHPGIHHVQAALNVFPLDAGLVDPPYDPREPLFPTRPIIPAPEILNAPPVVTAEKRPGDHGELFNELFGDDGEEEDEEEEDTTEDPPWGGGGDLVEELDGGEDEVEFSV